MLLQKTSFCFDVSVWELFWWAFEGASLCMLMPRGERMPQALIESIKKHRVSVLHFVPSMLNVFLGVGLFNAVIGGVVGVSLALPVMRLARPALLLFLYPA